MATAQVDTERPDQDEPEKEQEHQHPAWVEALQADTPKEEVHSRAMTNRAGQPVMRDGTQVVLNYVTARFVQDRLDNAVGPINWQSIFNVLPSGAVQCGIGLRDPQNTEDGWVWKWDVGVPSAIEPDKGAHSDAFKRAGVQWGIARDLYDVRDEDRLAPVAQEAAAGEAAPRRPVRSRVDQGEPTQMPVAAQYAEDGEEDPAWVCPVHDDAKIVPKGISKRTGRQYNAFYACPVAGCDQKGPSVT